MTLAQLNEHLELVRHLRKLKDHRDFLLNKANPKAQRLGGLPRSSSVSDPTADIGMELAELGPVLALLERRVMASEMPVREYIDSIPQFPIRLIFRQRFLLGKDWKEVADRVPFADARSVAKTCYKYLELHP